ncbi:unnamed protein product [Schistosoma turkestanicum]|nr:unnamed protein product [Schistosoma turkestanicum]
MSSIIFKQEATNDNSPTSISTGEQLCMNITNNSNNNNNDINLNHNNININNSGNDYLNEQEFHLNNFINNKTITPISSSVNKINSMLSISNNLFGKTFQNPFIHLNLTSQFNNQSNHQHRHHHHQHQTVNDSDNSEFINSIEQHEMIHSEGNYSTLTPTSSSSSSSECLKLKTMNNIPFSSVNVMLNKDTIEQQFNVQKLNNTRNNNNNNNLKNNLINSSSSSSVTLTNGSKSCTSNYSHHHHHHSRTTMNTGTTSTITSTTTTTTMSTTINQDCGNSIRSTVQNRLNNRHHQHQHHHHVHHYRSTSICSRASYMCRKCKTHGHNIPVKRHKRTCPYTNCKCIKCHLVDQGRKVVAKQIALYRDQTGSSHQRDIHEQQTSFNHTQTSANLHWLQPSSEVTVSSPSSSITATTTTLLSMTATNLEHNRIDEVKINKNITTPRNSTRLSNNNNTTTTTTGLHNPSLCNERINSSFIPLSSHSNSIQPMVTTLINDDKQTLTSGPHCRRCRNHSIAVTWKGHKKTCPFRNCPCDPCRLINVRKDTEKTLREMVSHNEIKPFTNIFKENRNNYSTHKLKSIVQMNSTLNETNNQTDYTYKSSTHLYNDHKINQNHFNDNENQQINENSLLLKPLKSSPCLTQLLHVNQNNNDNNNNNNNNNNNLLVNTTRSQSNHKLNSPRSNSIDSILSQNSSENYLNESSLPTSSTSLFNMNHLKDHTNWMISTKSISHHKNSDFLTAHDMSHLSSSSDWWIQPTNLLNNISTITTTTTATTLTSILSPSSLSMSINYPAQNPLTTVNSTDCCIPYETSLGHIYQKINNNSNNNNNNDNNNSTEFDSAITTDFSQMNSIEDYYESPIIKCGLTNETNVNFHQNDNNNNNKNYYHDNSDYFGPTIDFRNPSPYLCRINRSQAYNPTINSLNNNINIPVNNNINNNCANHNNNPMTNKFNSYFTSQLPNETAFYCPERVSAVAAAAAAAAAMVAMTPAINSSPRRCSHHHYHHHHCYAHTHCHMNQNFREDLPQRHEPDNIDDDYDEDDEDDIVEHDNLLIETNTIDPKRYHHYHHMYNQPIAIQHQQHHKSYETLDSELYSNLGQNRIVRDECSLGDSDIYVSSAMDKTCMITGNSLTYNDEYEDSPTEYYTRFNRSPRDWIDKETDDIQKSQEELTPLIRHTGNNSSRKHDLPITTTFQCISSSNCMMSLALNQFTVDKFHDSNVTTISLASSFIPSEVNSNLTVSFPRFSTNTPTSQTLDFINPIWRNQSNLKMNSLLSDTYTQINMSNNNHIIHDDEDDDDDDADDMNDEINDKQLHLRVSPSHSMINNSKLEFTRHNQSEKGNDENLSAWSLLQFNNNNNSNNNSSALMSKRNVESTDRITDENSTLNG